MLIIPFDRKIDWAHPPAITLFLILINCLIYFGWQSGDEQRLTEAVDFYQDSGLDKMEAKAYEDYRVKHKTEAIEVPPQEASEVQKIQAIVERQTHPDFMTAVRNESLIPVEDKTYADWQNKRASFEEKMSKVVFWEYGLKTAEFEPLDALVHMFLHGSFMHLLGNMFFLMAVGFLVERTFGSGAYLVCYLLAGMGGVALDFLLDPYRFIPGVGASGAISGLMGMYAVLFWIRPIRFFYFLFIIFGFATLPAITLLPIWVANELYQLLYNSGSHVNYAAHLGGLVSGGLIAFGVRRFLPSFSLDHIEQEDEKEVLDGQLAQAIEYCDLLEYRKAQPILTRLHNQYPDDQRILHYLHQSSRIQPASESYHRVSLRILSLDGDDPETNDWVLNTYREYLQRAKPQPRLGSRLGSRLARRFIQSGHLGEAEPLVAQLLKKPESAAVAADLSSMLGEKWVKVGDYDRGQKWFAQGNTFSLQVDDS